MSYNGSGTFLINSTGQPVVANTVISATVFNALTSDLATGLSTAITKDGQTTITANIPFGSNKITGLGAGTAATDAANLGQVQSTVAKLITVTGTDTITGTMSPALTAYAAGQLFYFVANAANTGAVTINIDGLGAKSITRDGATALAAGDINSGEFVVVIYDGTRFQMINAANSFGNTTINGTLTVTGNTGLQANVSITSTLSVGGTFAVTGAATLGSTLAVTGKSDLPTVSTASINAAVAVVTGLTATGASIASMNASVALLTTATVTTLTATGASIASANIGNLQFTAASIASINAGVAVITNLTATGASIASANVGTAVITTGTVTNLTSTSVSVASANAGVALITTGTVTNLTSTSASIASANVGTAVVTGLTVTGASIASVNAGTATLSGNLTLSGGTANGVLYLNGSKVATSGSALTFDGTTLNNTGATSSIRSTITGGTYSTGLNADGVYATGTDLYLLAPASKFISFYANNAEQMRLNSTGLGIGTSSPDERLTVTATNPTDGRVASLRNNATSSLTGTKLWFNQATVDNWNIGQPAGVNAFVFCNSTDSTNERLRIDSSGNVGIGTSSPTYKLDLSVTTNNGIRTTSSAGQQSYLGNTGGEAVTGTLNNYGFGIITNGFIRGYFDSSGNLGLGVTPSAWGSGLKAFQLNSQASLSADGTSVQLSTNAYFDGSNWKYIQTDEATNYYQLNGAHVWRTAASGTAGNTITFTQVLAVEGGKSVALEGATSQSGAGITFPATQSASSNANTLDDYEEGTWTGTLKGATTDPTTPVTATGKYTKIGRQVTVAIYFENVNTTGAAGLAYISGLPFTEDGTRVVGTLAVYNFDLNTGTSAYADFSGTFIYFGASKDDAAWVDVLHNAGASRYVRVTGTYFV